MKLFDRGRCLRTIVCAVIFLCGVFCSNDVMAGEGDDSGGEIAGCKFLNAFQLICNNGDGGASWHIYSTESYSGPTYTTRNNILSGGITVEDIKAECKRSDYGWYVAFGWDGRDNGSGYVHWGPANRKGGMTITNAQYNSMRGALNYDQAIELVEGTLGNTPENRTPGYGRQLTENAASKLYEVMTGSGSIPSNIGYFCFSEDKLNAFSGVSTVSVGNEEWENTPSNKKKSTGLAKSDESVTLEVEGCDDGCQIKINHSLVRENGNGKTQYKVYRESNDDSKITASWLRGNSTVMIEKNFAKNDTRYPVLNDANGDQLTIYTGQKVCEWMEFLTDGKSKRAKTEACVVATGDMDTTLDIGVRNVTLGQNDYNSVVYAKPDDEVELSIAYNPSIQGVISRIPDKVKIDGDIKANNNTRSLEDAYNYYRGNKMEWNNAFTVTSEGFYSVEYARNYNYDIGDMTQRNDKNTQKIGPGEVGREIKEFARTNSNSAIRVTPSQVVFTKENTNTLVANVKTDALESVATIRVPYNFDNLVSINEDKLNLYAGEEVTVSSATITIGERENGVTNGTYATKVDDPKLRLCVYKKDKGLIESADCTVAEYNGESWNPGEKTLSELRFSVTRNVPDVQAGTEMCVQVGIYPKTVANDKVISKEWNDVGATGYGWATQEKCSKVAKKPSFQVWGGNIYVGKEEGISVATKRVLDVDNGILSETDPLRIFGSWGELALASKDTSSKIASGNAFGYYSNTATGLSPEYRYVRGPRTADYEDVGNSENVHPGGGENGVVVNGLDSVADINMEDVIMQLKNYIMKLRDENKLKPMDVKKPYDMDDDIDLTGVDSDTGVIFEGDTIKNAVLYMGNRDEGIEDLFIAGNILYDSIGRSTLREIPKSIIYSDGNIDIACDVESIDAILIAKGNINTCPDSDGNEENDENDENKKKNSAQLFINGAVIVGGELILNRTYGAATGANSIIPAEIINMDPSWYLWMADMAYQSSTTDDSETTDGTDDADDDALFDGLLSPAHVYELPPRY